MRRPAAVAFDVIETLFSIEPLRVRPVDAGLCVDRLEVWFASLLRGAFALDATGVYQPFREVAESSLRVESARVGREVTPQALEAVIGGFAELEPHPDVAAATRALRDAGIRIVTLTNGSAEVSGKLLARAGLDDPVERTVSIAAVGRWKPSRAV